ncbi:uncharacterized protein METZ01_LOCUS373382, partial [marine metagenome]
VHGRALVVAHHIGSIHVISLLGPLVGNVTQEDDTISGLWIQDDVFLLFAPLL